MEKVKDEGNEALYDKLDSAYATDDDSSEVEDGEEKMRHIKTYNSENDSETQSEVENDNMYFPYEEFAYEVEVKDHAIWGESLITIHW